MIKKIKYRQLPDYIKSDVLEADFLTAYTYESADSNVIIWIANRNLNRPIEIEYDGKSKKLMTIEQRKKNAPLSATTLVNDLNAELVKTYVFEPETNILREVYEVVDLSLMRSAGKDSEAYYSAFKRQPTDIIKSIWKEYQFPTIYAQWTHTQKVNYWTERLYRMRRQAGESGAHEDCAFDKTLAQQMKNIDSDIEKILPDCIMKLSQLEQVDHAALLAAFRARTGLLI